MSKHQLEDRSNETPASLTKMIKLAAEECTTVSAESFSDADWVNGMATLIERIQRQPWHDTDKNYDPEVVIGQIRISIRNEVMHLLGQTTLGESDTESDV